ncbi:MAG: hypothetical protein V2B14_06965 [bacterium]
MNISDSSKVIGMLSLGLYTLHSITRGVRMGNRRTKRQMGQFLTDTFVMHQFAPKENILIEKVKKAWNNYIFDENMLTYFAKIVNVLSSCVKETVKNTVPFALALGAAFVNQPLVSGICASILLVLGGKVLLKDVLGFNKSKDIKFR